MVDWNQTLREFQGNVRALRVLNEATLEEAPRLIAAIRAAVDARDASKLQLSAHTLKGAMRYFGETAAYEEAFCLERLARAGDLRDAADALLRLDTAVCELLSSIEEYLLKTLPSTGLEPIATERRPRDLGRL